MKKQIDSKTLVDLFEVYFAKECEYGKKKPSIPKFGEYVRTHGFPSIKDYTIRRDEKLRAALEEAHEKLSEGNIVKVSVYQSFDVNRYYDHGYALPGLREAIVKREAYYKDLASSAAVIFKDNEDLKKRNNDLSRELSRTKNEKGSLQDELSKLNKENKQLKESLKNANDLLKYYLYPEIANSLLRDRGLLVTEDEVSSINKNKMYENTLKADDSILKVVKGLFIKEENI